MKKKRNGLVWKFTKKQNARGKYVKTYVNPPIYPVKRYDGQGNLIEEQNDEL
jgi:hypothetical protein